MKKNRKTSDKPRDYVVSLFDLVLISVQLVVFLIIAFLFLIDGNFIGFLFPQESFERTTKAMQNGTCAHFIWLSD